MTTKNAFLLKGDKAVNPYDVWVDDFADRVAARILPILLSGGKQPRSWMNVKEAAKHFGVSETTIREAVAAGEMPYTRIRGRLIILASEVLVRNNHK
ncbi:MAG: helix-turn-helix domain-containing protein [Dehalococcoidales bacterium]|nr:helix-turn-helix domain-containing protein [Dehalococcoidales bacterium]